EPHALPDAIPVVKPGLTFVLREGTPSEVAHPLDREIYERPEHEQKIVVRDLKERVNVVHLRERPRTHLGIPAGFVEMRDQKTRVVIALLATLLELPRTM